MTLSMIELYTELLKVAKARAEAIKSKTSSLGEACKEANRRSLRFRIDRNSHRPAILLRYLIAVTTIYMLRAEMHGEKFDFYEMQIDIRHQQLLEALVKEAETP